MTRHPFKFFFGLSLGVIVFFFVARVVVFALIMAAALSLLFFVGRKIKNFFKYMTWEEEYDSYRDDYRKDFYQKRNLPYWEREEEDLSFFDRPSNLRRERIIVIE